MTQAAKKMEAPMEVFQPSEDFVKNAHVDAAKYEEA